MNVRHSGREDGGGRERGDRYERSRSRDRERRRKRSRSRSRDRRDRRDRDRESRKGRIEEGDISIKEEPTWKDEVNVKEEPIDNMGYDAYGGEYGDYDDPAVRKIKEERGYDERKPQIFQHCAAHWIYNPAKKWTA